MTDREAAECMFAHFYLLPEKYGTPIGMELMEYGCFCEVLNKDDIDEDIDCARCVSFEQKED
jgi:hypothetical protein